MYENALKINLDNMNKFLNTEVQSYKKVKDKIENIHIEEQIEVQPYIWPRR